jgi:hypothetical protein
MATPDLSTVALLATYRVGYLPPAVCSLAPGELFIEALPPGGGVPRLWVGTARQSGFPGNNTLLMPDLTVTPSAIAINPIANPASAHTVRITGTVTPGAEIELAALQGTDPMFFNQVTAWSPWDASGGTFDMTWYLPPGDHYRVRVRMRADPNTFADSNLFAVIDDAPPETP